jgi:hypothetical protein
MLRLRHLTLAILLASILLSTAALARPLPGPSPRRTVAAASAPLDLFGRLWSFLSGLWSKNGCSVDPNGLCTPSPTPTSENGCGADPDGHCLSGSTTSTADNGCSADPNGHCGG